MVRVTADYLRHINIQNLVKDQILEVNKAEIKDNKVHSLTKQFSIKFFRGGGCQTYESSLM